MNANLTELARRLFGELGLSKSRSTELSELFVARADAELLALAAASNWTSMHNDEGVGYESQPTVLAGGGGGSQRDSLLVLGPLTVCYVVIFIAGLLGNGITCTVIARNKNMHTATNYYLFNLAVSDLMLLLCGE